MKWSASSASGADRSSGRARPRTRPAGRGRTSARSRRRPRDGAAPRRPGASRASDRVLDGVGDVGARRHPRRQPAVAARTARSSSTWSGMPSVRAWIAVGDVARRRAGRCSTSSVVIVAVSRRGRGGASRTSSAMPLGRAAATATRASGPAGTARRSGSVPTTSSGSVRDAAGERLEDLEGQVVRPVQVLERRAAAGPSAASARMLGDVEDEQPARRCASPARRRRVSVEPLERASRPERPRASAARCMARAEVDEDRGRRPGDRSG